MSADDDLVFMARALELAGRGAASADPNPTVGCVIVNDGAVVGEGFTRPAGGNHAEIEALNAAGARASGATVYVSLEPCAHTGRTGPCTTALIKAGVARVVFALEDPNPAVAGKGAERLVAAGITVETPLLATEAQQINRGFVSRMRRQRPWIRCKMAASLDGRTALANGHSQWITGEAARRDVHRWRALSSAVLTGVGTVLADDPALTARPDDLTIEVLQPKRVIVDSNLRTPPTARALTEDGETIIFCGPPAAPDAAERRAALQRAGASLEIVAAVPHCDLAVVVRRLAELEINSVWLEAGPRLAGAMLAEGLVDELILYLAPCLLGHDARPLFNLPLLEDLDQRFSLTLDEISQVGEDLRITARPDIRSGSH
jgi:diaminohydroxyphosphoribosylaminopyrimidine deaminase/5-amino-6-(5-phosphoribosylamino)uracil reductase